MNLEVFEGATTAREAVDAGKQARQQRFNLYTDLHSPRGVRAMMVHLPEEERHKIANQIVQAQQSKGGFPEYLARKVEESVGLPFGFLDQPYPYEQLRASMLRAKRLMRFSDARGEGAPEAIGKRNFEQLQQATEGLRGVSLAFYEKTSAKLKRLARRAQKQG
ncbi:hypothetical protein ACIPL1_27695 [Pseudomonas sp. NPDC090202]|uniref:hypothetical protein n=1 Tax=unclassified Pseudomonas TaxID=196821 RepID=UPI00382EDD21